MRIALIQSFLPSRSPGGVGHFTHQFANKLVERGHDVCVFSYHPAPAEARYQVHIVHLPCDERSLPGKLARLYWFGVVVARQDFSGFDIVHAQGDSHFLWGRRLPLVRTFSGSSLEEARHAGSLKRALMFLSIYPCELLAALGADACVAISRNTCRTIPGIQQVIPQGVDLERFRPGGQKSARPSILFVGHLRNRKRGQLLLDVFTQQVRPRLPAAELWLVCDERVEEPGVRSFGRVSMAQLIELYQRAWVFCLPSAYEGFGRPYIEAMACGTPVVATPNPGAMEVLEGGRYGVIASPAGLGRALVDLLHDGERRQRLAEGGLVWVQQFGWERVVDAYEALYRQLVRQAATQPAPATPARGCIEDFDQF